jgi:hypothetical protein
LIKGNCSAEESSEKDILFVYISLSEDNTSVFLSSLSNISNLYFNIQI